MKDYSFSERLFLKTKYGNKRAEEFIYGKKELPKDAFKDYQGDKKEYVNFTRDSFLPDNFFHIPEKICGLPGDISIAGLIGLFGGPISAVAAVWTFRSLKKRLNNPWPRWLLIGTIAMPVSNLAAQIIFKWDVNSFAVLQSFGRHRNYKSWKEADKLAKKEKEMSAIKSHPSFSAYKNVFEKDTCITVKDSNHLKTHDIYYNKHLKKLMPYTLYTQAEITRMWQNNPRYSKICLSMTTTYRGQRPASPKDIARHINSKIHNLEGENVVVLVWKSATESHTLFIGCSSKSFYVNKWGTKTKKDYWDMGRYIDDKVIDDVCANPSIRTISRRRIIL